MKQIFLVFNQISSREEKLIEIVPELKLMKTEEKDLYVKNIFTGLKEKEEYFKEKKRKASKKHQEKFLKVYNNLVSDLNKNS